ncbi:hypothetical protein VTH82DRAFT_763 [Thermothelomyces myriococcoides]
MDMLPFAVDTTLLSSADTELMSQQNVFLSAL